jgi:hypothetical protein
MRAPLGATTLADLLSPADIDQSSAAGTTGGGDRVAIAA